MKTWLTSLNGTLTISALALLSFIGYTLMEMRYYLEKWIPGDSAAMVEAIVILLIVGGWLWALFAARDGRRGGVIALFALSLFAILIGLYDMRFVLYSPMPWPEQFTVFSILVVGVIAAVAVGAYLRSSKQTA